jgi:hypothetical protein
MTWLIVSTTMNVSIVDNLIRPLGIKDRLRVPEARVEEKRHSSNVVSNETNAILSRSQSIPVVPSKSIPISSLKRTPSEVQLQEDEAMAEYRDYCFYVRLVNGMNATRHHYFNNDRHGRSTDASLANIMRTRNLPVRNESFGSREPHGRDPRNLQNPRQSSITQSDALDDDRDEGIFVMDM